MRQKLGITCSPLDIRIIFKTAANILDIQIYCVLHETWLSALNHKRKVTYVHLLYTARSLGARCDRAVPHLRRSEMAKRSFTTATQAAAEGSKNDTRGTSLHCELWQPWVGEGVGGRHMLTVD